MEKVQETENITILVRQNTRKVKTVTGPPESTIKYEYLLCIPRTLFIVLARGVIDIVKGIA